SASAKRKDAFDQRLSASAGLHHVVDVAPLRATVRRSFLRHLAIAQNRPEDVVEVVRDSASQRAHRFELLRLAKLLLEASLFFFGNFARRDVDRRAEKAIGASGAIAQTSAADLQPMPLRVRMTYAVLQF